MNEAEMMRAALNPWQPISEMADKYDGIFLLAAPELIHGDWNPQGVNIGWWQDDEGWRSTAWNGSQDFTYDIIVNPTHFQRIKGPYTPEELDALEMDADEVKRPPQ